MASKETVEKTQPLRVNGGINHPGFLRQYHEEDPSCPHPDKPSDQMRLARMPTHQIKSMKRNKLRNIIRKKEDSMDWARFGCHLYRRENNASIPAHLLKLRNPKAKPPNLTSQSVY